jgi:hypothetical protein
MDNTIPEYVIWSNNTIAQVEAMSSLRFFRFGWVDVWATDGDTAEAIVRRLLDSATVTR